MYIQEVKKWLQVFFYILHEHQSAYITNHLTNNFQLKWMQHDFASSLTSFHDFFSKERPWGIESHKRGFFWQSSKETSLYISKTFINCHADVFPSLSLLLLIYMNMDCKNCAMSLQANEFIMFVKIRKLSVKTSALTDDKLRSLYWPFWDCLEIH